jgi:hypothetical protein
MKTIESWNMMNYHQSIPYTYSPRPNPRKEQKSTHAYVAGLFKVKQREMIVKGKESSFSRIGV